MPADEQRLPDTTVLGLVAERMAQFGGSWELQGSLLKGPGTTAIVLGEDHSGHPRHLDLTFILNVDQAAATAIHDCVTGFGPDPVDAARQAIHNWAITTATPIVELLSGGRGTYCDQFPADDPEGLPGWHCIHGGLVSFGPDSQPMHQWALGNRLLPPLAPSLRAGLTRQELNGIKIFMGGSPGNEVAEVRINGQPDEAASAALLALPWPRLSGFTRTFILAIHPE